MSSGTDVQSTLVDDVSAMHKIVTFLHGWFARVRENHRVSLFPKTDVEARLVHEQLAMIRESTKGTVLILPFLGGLIALYDHAVLPWFNMAGWWIALTAVCIAGEITSRRLKEINAQVTPRTTSTVACIHTAWTIVITLVWASMIFAFWVPDDALNHVVLVLLLAASLSSASSVSAPHYASARAALWIYGTIMFFGPIVMGGTIDFTMAAMTAVFAISMSANMRSNFETTRKMLSLQDERTGLIANLRSAKKESDIARDRAEKASRAKSQFLANMSHELRTPMNAILGFSEMIQNNIGASREKTSEYAQIINQSGQHLLGLINDVLDLAKIESGAMQLREGRVALPQLAEDCLRLMGARAETGKLVLINDVPETLPDLQADERALRQILLNLLSNAVKFTHPGGEVHVFGELRDNGAVALGVRDTGVGIAAEDLKRVFENFGQGRHDVVSADKGTGLGLPIVKGLVVVHGGQVELKSTVGSGTSVTVILPPARVLSTQPAKLAS